MCITGWKRPIWKATKKWVQLYEILARVKLWAVERPVVARAVGGMGKKNQGTKYWYGRKNTFYDTIMIEQQCHYMPVQTHIMCNTKNERGKLFLSDSRDMGNLCASPSILLWNLNCSNLFCLNTHNWPIRKKMVRVQGS